MRAQSRKRGYQSSAAIWGGLIDPLATARGTYIFASTRGAMNSKRRIKINGRGCAGDAFMILRAHLSAFRRVVRRRLEPGKVYRFQQFLLAVERAHVRTVKLVSRARQEIAIH